ncbi:M81 family metallopeptidase [Consotaella aegiceratis]|uniref:M81 family metallopeptidase n=1 Tax=Consotaella aegiceratis TaxID=3097961 RepID=UPI002F3F9145
MRIAVGGIHVECSTYNPVLIEEHDFRVVRGEALTADARFAFLKDYDAEFLPTLHARAVPCGPVSRRAYEAFKADFLARLQALGPIDGLYLAMHGAMNVEGMDDAEGDWITAARAVVGDAVPVSASYDLHGNLSQRIIDALDMYSTYRTAPHIDVEETMRRAVTMLVRSIETGERPILLWAPIPLVLPGERTSTEDQPAKRLYAGLPALDALPGIWDASLNVGYVWADEPRATAAAIFTGTDRDVLETQAKALAQSYWDVRDEFAFGPKTGSIEDCVGWAIASATRPVILADSGDNPTGGGVGDRADVLAELIRRDAQDTVVVGITDRPALEAAFAAGLGATLSLAVGASLDPSSPRVTVEAKVLRLVDAADASEREAVVRFGGITLVLAARRRPYHDIADFARLGLDPKTAGIVVVKSGYLSPELAPIANPNLMALSPGVVDQDIERLPRPRKAKPTWPFDKTFEFEPQVALSARSAARLGVPAKS